MWSLKAPTKGIDSPITSQDTTKVNEEVMVERLIPLSLTYVKTWTLTLCLVSTSFTCSATMGLNVSKVSKTPMIKW